MIRDEDVHFHAPDPGEPTWAETNFFGFYNDEAKLNVGVYALFRTNLGIVSSTICMNSGFARAPWEADFCDLRASMPIPEPRNLSDFKLDNSLSIRCLKPNMDWQINYDDGAGTSIDVLYRSIMPPFDIHDPDMDPMKAKALKAAEADGKFAWGTAYNGHFDEFGPFPRNGERSRQVLSDRLHLDDGSQLGSSSRARRAEHELVARAFLARPRYARDFQL